MSIAIGDSCSSLGTCLVGREIGVSPGLACVRGIGLSHGPGERAGTDAGRVRRAARRARVDAAAWQHGGDQPAPDSPPGRGAGQGGGRAFGEIAVDACRPRRRAAAADIRARPQQSMDAPASTVSSRKVMEASLERHPGVTPASLERHLGVTPASPRCLFATHRAARPAKPLRRRHANRWSLTRASRQRRTRPAFGGSGCCGPRQHVPFAYTRSHAAQAFRRSLDRATSTGFPPRPASSLASRELLRKRHVARHASVTWASSRRHPLACPQQIAQRVPPSVIGGVTRTAARVTWASRQRHSGPRFGDR
jgi:hypothetical protein